MKKFIVLLSLLIAIIILQSSISKKYHRFPPTNCTGAPNAYTCGYCHSDYPENMAGGGISINGIPATFTKGITYPFSILIHHFAADRQKFGYDITALDAYGNHVGLLGTSNPNSILADTEITSNNPPVLAPTGVDLISGFSWTAPDSVLTSDRLPITFYFCGNACNYDGKPNGDYIYTDSFKTTYGLLPVINNQLSLIGISNGQVQLNWRFTNYTNVKYYIIQKSLDNIHFQNIDTFSTVQNFNCTYIDKNILDVESCLYRILSVDLFGIKSYSNIERYNQNSLSKECNIYAFPNPVKPQNNLNISITIKESQKGNINVFNNDGKLLYQDNISLLKGTNTYQLLLDNRYSKGAYFLIYQSESNKKSSFEFYVQ